MIARNVRPKARRSQPRRVSVHRDKGYLAFLREEGKCVTCLICFGNTRNPHEFAQWGACDPAHGPVAGMRMKGADNEAIPLCRACHFEQHAIGWPKFEAKYGFSREKEAATWYTAWLIVKEGNRV